MSATNTTTHYELPSFIGSDKPAWLVDWNGAMAAIDSAIYEAKSTADQAVSAASAVASDVSTLSGTVSTQGTTITTLSETLTTAVGNINTINSLIGNGTPTTTDQTIIGAINELHADIQELQPVTAGRIISVGDSYATEATASNYNEKLEAMFSSSDFYKVAEPACGFIQTGTSGHTVLTLLQSVASDIPNHDTITDIIITNGVNDARDATYIAGLPTAINAVIAYIKSEYPNAKIHYGFIGNFMSSSTHVARLPYLLQAVPLFYDEFNKAGADCMKGAEFIMHDARNGKTTDYTHPSSRGAEEIAKFIYTWLTEGYARYQTYYESRTENDTGIFTAVINGEQTEVFIQGWDSTAGGSITTLGVLEALPSDFPVRGSYDYNFIQPGSFGVSYDGVRNFALGFCRDGNLEVQLMDSQAHSVSTPSKLKIVFNTMYA